MNTISKNIIKIAVVVVVLGAVIMAAAGMFPGSGQNNAAKNESEKGPIRIGASISLTGVAADFGEMSKKAMELAVEEINAKGGINSRKVELFIEDDQTDPKTAVSAYQKLVHVDKVEALIGGIFDFTAQPIFPLALQDKITYISPVNFVIDDTFEMNEQTFVMYPRFDQVVSELKSVIDEKGIQKLGMIRFESGFSASIQKTLAGIMTDLGRELLVTETYAAIGSSDFRTNILKMKSANPDAVFLDMLDFDIVKYLADSKALGFKKQILGYTTMRDVLAKKDVDLAALEGAIMLDWEIPSEAFSKAFSEKYGISPRRGANKSYDAIYVLAEAIANSANRAAVASYIETHSFNTVNGSFKFGADHAVTDTPVKVFEVRGGKLEEIKAHR